MTAGRRLQGPLGPDDEDDPIIDDEPVLQYVPSDSDPNQRALDELLARVDRIRVTKGDELLLDIRGAKHVRTLAATLRIIEDPDLFGRYKSPCDHAIELFAGERRLATLGLHRSCAIRWDAWSWDAMLMQDTPLLDWLAARGVPGPRERFDADSETARRQTNPLYRWDATIPHSLRPFWPDRHVGGEADPELAAALAQEFPDPLRRAAVLFAWFGSGTGSWTDYPRYEDIPEQLLLELPLDTLIQAASEARGEALEGAARLFASVGMNRHHPGALKALSEQTRRAMLEYVLPFSDDERRERVLAAFGESS